LGKRRKSREFALQVLYQLDITSQDPIKTIAQCRDHFSHREEKDGFAERIALGVLEQGQKIDRLIEQYSENWRLDRMPTIDRNILRMATFELLYCEDIPPKVTLNEAIELGKRYGSEDSGSFINGILDRIQNEAVRKPFQPKRNPQ
jgi:transcription antitermination protein NusB